MNKILGSVIVISGPSGVGKSTLIKLIKTELPDLKFSVSCTTRMPRPGEIDGREYHFISSEKFEEKVQNHEFIEYAGVFAKRYGTLKSEVLAFVENGQDVLLDIDVQGAMQIQRALQDDEILKKCCEFIFIAPPSLTVLEERLRFRQSDSEEQILLRLSKAGEEISHWRKYKYLIINDEAENAAQKLLTVIKSFKLQSVRRITEIF